MRLCYIAYPNSLRLRSANAVQTHATLAALRAQLPDLLVIIPRSERGPSDFDAIRPLYLPRIAIGRLSRLYRSTLWYYAERTAFAWLALAVLLARRAAGRPADVIYVREVICAFWLALLAPRLLGARVVYEAHDLESRNPSRARERLAQPLLHLVDRLALTRPAALVSLTAEFRTLLARLGLRALDTVAVLPDAYDAARYVPHDRGAARQALDLPPDARLIVYTGLTFAYRGLDLLVAALPDLPDAELLLVGGRERERSELLEQARRLGVAGRVRVAGTQPQERIPLYLAAADLVAIPGTVTDVTASPLKLFEAMAMARAVVCPDLPALREITHGDGALHVPAGDRAALAAAIGCLLADAGLRRSLEERALERVAPHTYARRAARLLAICRRTAEASPADIAGL